MLGRKMELERMCSLAGKDHLFVSVALPQRNDQGKVKPFVANAALFCAALTGATSSHGSEISPEQSFGCLRLGVVRRWELFLTKELRVQKCVSLFG